MTASIRAAKAALIDSGRTSATRVRSEALDDGCAARAFAGPAGTEHFLALTPPVKLGLAEQIDWLEQRYRDAQRSLGLDLGTAVFRRIYVSDAPNQSPLVRTSSLFSDPVAGPVAISLVQQPPLPGVKVSLFAYHIETDRPLTKLQLAPNHVLVEKAGFAHLWSTRLCSGLSDTPTPTAEQTRQIFGELTDALSRQLATLADNCIRTWIYVKDVDAFYEEMVASRLALFEEHGLTRDTHYIASTGIEGACEHRYDTVLMDAYSIIGLTDEQITYLNDLSRLCYTKDYNVAFERGVQIAYADRAHQFISGTASIDASGRVVHVGDVGRQLERALGNAEALLQAGGASLDDLTHLIVYLRDPADYLFVQGYLSDRFTDLPTIVLRGAVCRPDWLIEVEGVGITTNNAPHLPSF
jgi:enamine deaminase RidA (YjgF/YER057c/UK114 family)